MSRNICDIHDEIIKKSNKIGRLKSGDLEDSENKESLKEFGKSNN